ncbi:hypothetical protein BDZ97DRAFT_1680111 [Flammula alnicola]|nr:hypothetical protein BDZ97DRAFT_1680111 [Flammula alnicola]
MGKSSMNSEINTTKLSPRHIPTLSYAIQNILISIASIISSMTSFFFTVSVILPLSILRLFIPADFLRVPSTQGSRRVILIVGASRSIGLNVLKQYADDPDAVIIAASSSIDSIRNVVVGLGDTRATVQCTEVDLSLSRKQVADNIRSLDKQYGPITHLYQVSGISNHLKDNNSWGLDVTADMIGVNVTGTVASVLTMYELMKQRGFGNICIVGSAAGLYGPANMISYASTKSFINTFSTSLRVLAAQHGVDVITVQPGLIDTSMTKQMRSQGSTVPAMEFASAEKMAMNMKQAVEGGGVGVVSWPLRQSVVMYALKAINPICEEIGRWASMEMGLAGRKIT